MESRTIVSEFIPMLAAFGMPGHLELLIIGMICLLTVGLPIFILVVVWWIIRKNRGDR